MSKLALLNEENLFKLDFMENNKTGQPPVSLFQEIEAELCNHFLHGGSPEDDETDGEAEFIKNIVGTVRAEIENLIENADQKKFLNILTKILNILLSVKANSEKIIKIVKLAISAILKTWSELN